MDDLEEIYESKVSFGIWYTAIFSILLVLGNSYLYLQAYIAIEILREFFY